MREDDGAELRWALAEGLLSREEAEALGEEAGRLQTSPLELLLQRGRLSDETLLSLRAAAIQRRADPEATAQQGADAAGQDHGPEAPAFPVTGWDRYQVVRFLGQGGMGRVFLARDPRLRREVALKFVRGDDRELTRRFIAEARAQARVRHSNVCEVYEVGEIQGRVYIAMQYIRGRPLGAVARELNVEQRARVIRDVAEGVHEAHRAGILHRDIKPANILVERTDDGDLKPYVVDFGLARASTEGATETGTVMGTPHYMAPEQARGEVAGLDRRADVYALGATLYHALVGEPPIPGSNGLEVLNNVMTVEPRPPRAIDPDVPADLEAVSMKCLEKDRAARYDSARALAEDLDRFLRGEIVLARSAGALRRLGRRLRRHRRAAAAAAAALALVLCAIGWGAAARLEVAERERLARRFTARVEHVEAMARYAALSPLHDTRADRRGIREEMDALEGEIRRGGAVAAGPGEYALGRGYLALGDEAAARAHLEAAWQGGFREPRAAYALALILGGMYRQGLIEAERIQSPALREAKEREIEGRYRAPALEYLRQSAGAEIPSAEYVAALLAFYEGRLDDALGHLDAIGGGLPWFHEAPALRGDILLTRALARRNEGDRAGARADFDAGRRAYAAAAAVAESVPAVHVATGELEYGEMVMELYGGGDVAPPFERGLAAASRALTAMPDDYGALVLKARLQRSMAEHRANQGGDAEDLLREAADAARAAIAAEPSRAGARLELGRVFRQWGELRRDRSLDPTGELRQALEISETIRPEDRDYDFHAHLGLVFAVWADYEDQVGADSLQNRSKAIASYAAALQINERATQTWINLGINYYTRASHPRSADPDGDLREARAALDKARAQDPAHVVACFYGGEIEALAAERERARGGDARPALAAALEQYQKGLAVNPKLPHLHIGAGAVLLRQAREAWDRGGDPDPLLADAREAFERAIAAAPEQPFGYHNVGEALAQRALYQRARGEDPGPIAREAVSAIERAIQRLPGHSAPWANLGMVHAIEGRALLDRGRDPGESVERAFKALGEALRRNPGDAQAELYLGEARGARALWRALRGEARPEDFEEAARAFEKALELAPRRQDYAIAFGQFCTAWAAWQKGAKRDPDPALRRALDLADQVLAARPGAADARLLRGSALLALAETSGTAEERREWKRRGQEDVNRALADNPNLKRAWERRAATAVRPAVASR
jgi:serine/threonine-protein kinase